jgi:hypothetical protein
MAPSMKHEAVVACEWSEEARRWWLQHDICSVQRHSGFSDGQNDQLISRPLAIHTWCWYLNEVLKPVCENVDACSICCLWGCNCRRRGPVELFWLHIFSLNHNQWRYIRSEASAHLAKFSNEQSLLMSSSKLASVLHAHCCIWLVRDCKDARFIDVEHFRCVRSNFFWFWPQKFKKKCSPFLGKTSRCS